MQKTDGYRQPVQPAVSMGARRGHKQPLARLHADGKLCSRAASCNRNTTSVLLHRVGPTRESQADIRVCQKWSGLADSASNSTTTAAGRRMLPGNGWRTSKGFRQGCYAGGVSHDCHAVCARQAAARRNNCLLRALQCGGSQEVICARTSSLSHPLRRG